MKVTKRQVYIGLGSIVVLIILLYAFCSKAEAQEPAAPPKSDVFATAAAIYQVDFGTAEPKRPTITVVTVPQISTAAVQPVSYRPSYTRADVYIYKLQDPVYLDTFTPPRED